MDFQNLKQLCQVQASSGDEGAMTDFLLNYINEKKETWNVQPEILSGGYFQEAIILVFGKPKTAIFAHIDSIGFTVGYDKDLIRIGGPVLEDEMILVGEDSKGKIECETMLFETEDGRKSVQYVFDRTIDRGTPLVYKCNFREDEDFVQSCYLDNRLGVWNALQVAENLENGVIVFSCREEHGSGSAEYLGNFLFNKYELTQALISDITWVTEGVEHGKGVAISMRDSGIPRRKYLNRIIEIAKQSSIPFQLEVESGGGSDGNALQKSSSPWQWCFIGAAEDYVHSPNEKVNKLDILSMVDLYKVLMEKL